MPRILVPLTHPIVIIIHRPPIQPVTLPHPQNHLFTPHRRPPILTKSLSLPLPPPPPSSTISTAATTTTTVHLKINPFEKPNFNTHRRKFANLRRTQQQRPIVTPKIIYLLLTDDRLFSQKVSPSHFLRRHRPPPFSTATTTVHLKINPFERTNYNTHRRNLLTCAGGPLTCAVPNNKDPMSAAVSRKPGKKFPPPCWTRDEALVLIEAYRERWHALHRAFLRNPDWDAVAEKVTTRCPDVTPPKTSAQCRHKMEKLRQRHRAEKQRASAFPGGHFFSSWFYFEAMEAMENGSSSEPGNNDSINSTPLLGLNPGRGIRFKPSSVQNLVTLATSSTKTMKSIPNFSSRVSNHYPSFNDEEEDGYYVETPIGETLGYRGKDTAKIHKNSSINGGIRTKPSIHHHQESGHIGLRPRKFSKVVVEDEADDNGEMWIKVPRNTNLFRGNYQNKKKSNSSFDVKRKKRGTKVKNGGIDEMVSSIKLLGDGFMKMEQMKMEMAQEIEKMRMEAEMKRNQLILESQKQIVDAFLKGLIESKQQETIMAES